MFCFVFLFLLLVFTSIDTELHERYYHPQPGRGENTQAYSPPEVIFTDEPFYKPRPESYDMWALGVLVLEMIYGDPDVFSLSARRQTMLRLKLPKELDGTMRENTLKLYVLRELCIAPPPVSNNKTRKRRMNDEGDHDDQHDGPIHSSRSHHDGPSPSTSSTTGINNEARARTRRKDKRHDSLDHDYYSRNCGSTPVDQFRRLVQERDVLGLGVSATTIDFVYRLLQWNPERRMTVDEALEHPFFEEPEF